LTPRRAGDWGLEAGGRFRRFGSHSHSDDPALLIRLAGSTEDGVGRDP
jgi:hypothetical protein